MMYVDFGSSNEDFAEAALRGLRGSPRKIAPKFFYDERGSELFERICEQPEYYPTRVETRILQENIRDISRALENDQVLIEFGSGASLKTKILLENMPIRTYIPMDISKSFLLKTAEMLRAVYPKLEIIPAHGDFLRSMRIPEFLIKPDQDRLAFLPGSTLGNFDPVDAIRILRSIHGLLGSGHLLIGVDLAKDPQVLESAYNDAAGMTAEFNKNLIQRLRRETGAEVWPESFEHRAFYNEALGRIEMHLTARERVSFRIRSERIDILPGESIHTENSYKYRPAVFEKLCRNAGFELVRFWTDPKEWFGEFLLRVGDSRIEASPPSSQASLSELSSVSDAA